MSTWSSHNPLLGEVIVRNSRGREQTVAAGLLQEHRAYLEARGVSVGVAQNAGIRSVADRDSRALLGRSQHTGFGLAIPYDLDYWVLRLDYPKGGRKFLYPGGKPTRPYLPPVVPLDLWLDPKQPLVICEGPVKALALAAADIPAIGLAGATGGGHDAARKRETGEVQLHETLATRVSWAGRRAIVMLDSDAHDNPTVQAGQSLVARALHSAGAEVFLAPVPQSVGPKMGPDDFLVRHGTSAVVAHIAKARAWAPRATDRDPASGPRRLTGISLSQALDILSAALPLGSRVEARKAYDIYRFFCLKKDDQPLSETALFRALADPKLGYRKTKSRGRKYWRRVG